jgi:hypothetical protein
MPLLDFAMSIWSSRKNKIRLTLAAKKADLSAGDHYGFENG